MLNAKLIIIGLAPAAHGGTRTGRAFTGDKSGDFLFKSLYSVKLSNQNYSKKIIFDGYPRNLNQARKLDNLLNKYSQKINIVQKLSVSLNLPLSEISLL